jgi:glutathione S-transferase
MKLYYAPGACSLSPHIIANEAGLALELIKVDLATKRTEFDEDFYQINPNGYVPTLLLDNGSKLGESAVISQYLADLASEKNLIPPAGNFARYQVQQWLNFIASEIHKNFSPLFNPAATDAVKEAAISTLNARFTTVAKQLNGQNYLVGEQFSVADAYLFVTLSWRHYVNFDISAWPVLVDYETRIAARPAVQQAMQEEGLI